VDCTYPDQNLTLAEQSRADPRCKKKRDDVLGMQREYASLEIMYQGLDTVYRRTPSQRLAPALAASPPTARPRRPPDAAAGARADCPTSVMTSTPATLASPFFKCCTCASPRAHAKTAASI
jgi:hypothetical protein